MEFGTFLLLQSPSARASQEIYARGIELAQAAEALGFHSTWLAEHHFSTYGYLSRPVQLATYIAAKTTRLRVGTAVIVRDGSPSHDELERSLRAPGDRPDLVLDSMPDLHDALRAARRACITVSATTTPTTWPMNSTLSIAKIGSSCTKVARIGSPGMSRASSTARTPGIASAWLVSTPRSLPCATVERMGAACSVPFTWGMSSM